MRIPSRSSWEKALKSKKHKDTKTVAIITAAYVIGVIVGAIVFRQIEPRSVLAMNNCQSNCWRPNEITGLLAAVGIRYLPGQLPQVIKETDKSIVLVHPFPEASIHYIIIPKKDIKNIGERSLLFDRRRNGNADWFDKSFQFEAGEGKKRVNVPRLRYSL